MSAEFENKLASDNESLAFPLLSDPQAKLVKELGLFDKKNSISLPAILILDRNNQVKWKYVGGMITDRPDPEDVLEALKKSMIKKVYQAPPASSSTKSEEKTAK